MHTQCVIGEFESASAARQALMVLRQAGFNRKHVSLVIRHDDPGLDEITEWEEGAANSTGTDLGAGIGALLGGAMVAPIAVGTLVGPFVLVGPLVAMGLGAAVGGALGGAQEWGVNPKAGATYEDKVQAGHILIIVSGSKTQIREARNSLKTTSPLSLTQFARPESNGAD